MTEPVRVPMLVGSELHIAADGELTVSNPPATAEPNESGVSAVLTYQFDRARGIHIIRLLEPVAAHPPRGRSEY